MRSYRWAIVAVLLGGAGVLWGEAKSVDAGSQVQVGQGVKRNPGEPNDAMPRQLDDPNFLKSKVRQRLGGPSRSILPWGNFYHPQVTAEIFRLIDYPYYPGGSDFLEYPNEEQGQPESGPEKPQAAGGPVFLDDLGPGFGALLAAAPRVPVPSVPAGAAAGETQRGLAKYCDFVHQWRQINEAPGTALEILHTVELTRLKTGIYERHPALAVSAKRAVGQIGRVNRHFESTRQMLLTELAKGVDKVLLARLEKQLGELKGQLESLAGQNDAMSQALGMGKIDRDLSHAAVWEPVDYTHDRLPGH